LNHNPKKICIKKPPKSGGSFILKNSNI
jgi:hypothetical protein